MKVSTSTFTIAFIAVALRYVDVMAMPDGSPVCTVGSSAPQSYHLSREPGLLGGISVGSFEVKIGGTILTNTAVNVIPAGTTLTLDVRSTTGGQFRGVLVVLNKDGVDLSSSLTTVSSDLQAQTSCYFSGYSGFTHSNRDLKNFAEGSVTMPSNQEAFLDVNIVVANNNGQGSIFYYTRFQLLSETMTLSPVNSPVRVPVRVPVRNPVRVTTQAPTKTPVHIRPPAKAPVRAPVRTPTKAPIRTQAPTKRPVRAPVEAPTKTPVHVRPPAKAPVRAPTLAPTKSPIRAPVRAPMKSPVRTPVRAPSPIQVPIRAPFPSPVRSPASVPVPVSMPLRVAPISVPIPGAIPILVAIPASVPVPISKDPAPVSSPLIVVPTNAPTTMNWFQRLFDFIRRLLGF